MGLWVSQVGQVIVARIRGDLTKKIMIDLSFQITQLAQTSRISLVLVDALEMNPPDVDTTILQWKINDQQKVLKLRRAIVVPNARLAYLARLAFGEAEHRIFYNDLAAAMSWLTSETPKT